MLAFKLTEGCFKLTLKKDREERKKERMAVAVKMPKRREKRGNIVIVGKNEIGRQKTEQTEEEEEGEGKKVG